MMFRYEYLTIWSFFSRSIPSNRMSGEMHFVANEGGNNNEVDFDQFNIAPGVFIVAFLCVVPVITHDLVSVRISLSSTIFNDDGNGANVITTINSKNGSFGTLTCFRNAQMKIEHMFIEFFLSFSLPSLTFLFVLRLFEF